jgi:hypothetical protein
MPPRELDEVTSMADTPITPDSAQGHIQNARFGLSAMRQQLPHYTLDQMREVMLAVDARLLAALGVLGVGDVPRDIIDSARELGDRAAVALLRDPRVRAMLGERGA